jgi:DNA-binding response OmpR family regulator
MAKNGAEARQRRILAVDDDASTRLLVEGALVAAGFVVTTRATAAEALAFIRREGLPHLAVVDLVMPEMGGLELCARLKEWSDLPIVILTAVDTADSVVAALDRYADDYLTKPFDGRELAARVRAVLRRTGDFAYTLAPRLAVDDRLAVDLANQRALVDERPVKLTPTETKLLYLLMHAGGRPVRTEFLLSRLWPGEEVFEDALRVHVHRLRAKIEKEPQRPCYVVTERGIGYSFPAPPRAQP